jgi:hypothetical protein
MAVAALAAIVTASCGGGAENASPGITSTPAGAASSAASAGAPGRGRFCDAARRFNADQGVIDRAVAQAAHGTAPPGRGAQASASLRAARDAEVVSATMPGLAPGSLTADVRTVAATWQPFFAAVIRAGGDVTKVPLAAEQTLRSVVTTPRFQAAAQKASAYQARACGLTPPHGH